MTGRMGLVLRQAATQHEHILTKLRFLQHFTAFLTPIEALSAATSYDEAARHGTCVVIYHCWAHLAPVTREIVLTKLPEWDFASNILFLLPLRSGSAS